MAGLAGLALHSPLTLATPTHRHVHTHAPGTKALSLRNLHTNDQVSCTYWIAGQYQPDALQEVNMCLRDHRSGDIGEIDPLLLDSIHALVDDIGYSGEIHIISGYRSPKTNDMLRQRSSGVAKKSYHMLGRAVDLRLPQVSLSQLHKAALTLHNGGVGYYPKSNFLHLDTGPKRNWS
jgi:uncharacterized protein YcbK (DUF882 family)